MLNITNKVINSIHRFQIRDTESKVSIYLIDSPDFKTASKEEAIINFDKKTKEFSSNKNISKQLVELADFGLRDELRYLSDRS